MKIQFFTGLLLLTATSAFSQTIVGGQCQNDAQALCSGLSGGAAMSCLMKNVEKIQNATCKYRVKQFRSNDSAVKQTCSADIKKDGCSASDIGTGLIKCLESNRKSLSKSCDAEIKELVSAYGDKNGKNGKTGKDLHASFEDYYINKVLVP